MTLSEYKQKRNFSETTEPGDSADINANKENNELIFVVQKHDASHLHYDLRLEVAGVLKSWAVPKTPPEEPGVKRLAVETEDHPIEYAGFEGVIPEGNYGAGTVEIWDKGKFIPGKIENNEIIFRLEGNKLNGSFALIRLKNSKNWLFFKKK
jgi:DNA ligase D-like protein (predicted 3'-phosphoesterase)